jgi:phenylacetate-CoA ligase
MSKKYWNEKIETLPRAELEAYQLETLKEYLVFAYNNSLYYHKSFDEHGVNPNDLKELSDLRKFPFINKKIERDRQIAAPFLGDLACVKESDVVYISASSGSTGVPTISPFTLKDFDDWQDVEARLYWMVGMRPNDRYLHALNFALFVGGPDVIGAQNLGALCIWAGTVPSDKLLFIMKEFQPTITWTTPSYAWHLGESAKAHGIDPAKDLSIRKIIVAGETGGSISATRKEIEKLWNAQLFDFYGISDIFGACAGMCEHKDGLHLAEDHILVEVIDPNTLLPIKDGEQGEIVFTTLKKRARPMIRFRSGDIGFVNREKCKCGRTHTRIYITGRIDDMFIVSGVNVFPSDIEYVVRTINGLTGEYRIIIDEEEHLTKFDIEVEKEDDILPIKELSLSRELSKKIKERLGVKPRNIKILQKGDIPRATHKAKRIIDQRKKS